MALTLSEHCNMAALEDLAPRRRAATWQLRSRDGIPYGPTLRKITSDFLQPGARGISEGGLQGGGAHGGAWAARSMIMRARAHRRRRSGRLREPDRAWTEPWLRGAILLRATQLAARHRRGARFGAPLFPTCASMSFSRAPPPQVFPGANADAFDAGRTPRYGDLVFAAVWACRPLVAHSQA